MWHRRRLATNDRRDPGILPAPPMDGERLDHRFPLLAMLPFRSYDPFFTLQGTGVAPVPGPIAGAGLPGLILRERRPSRPVATAQSRGLVIQVPSSTFGMMWPCSEALAAGGRRAGDLRPVAALTGGAAHSGQGSGAKTNTFDVPNGLTLLRIAGSSR
jgi:hypothetical protein